MLGMVLGGRIHRHAAYRIAHASKVRPGPIRALSVSEALGRGHGVPVLLQSLLAWIIGELEPG